MSKLIKGIEALTAIANGVQVQFLRKDKWEDAVYCMGIQFIQDVFEFRLKPNLLKIGDVEIEAPVSDLVHGQIYYLADITETDLYSGFCFQADTHGHYLKRKICHASVENAVAHAKALILVGGGEIPLIDTPEPVTPEPEPAAEKKRRVKKEPVVVVVDAPVEEAGSIDISADISFESETVHELKPDIPFESFVTPASVEFDEPQPEDLVSESVPVLAAYVEVQAVAEDTSESAKRVRYLLGDIAKAKTGSEVLMILDRYTNGLSAEDKDLVTKAAAKRNGDLSGLSKFKSDPSQVAEPEKPSLAVRIQSCTSIDQLAKFNDEINALPDTVQSRMQVIYDKRLAELQAEIDQPTLKFNRTGFCAGVYMIGEIAGEAYQVDIPWRISRAQQDGKFVQLTDDELDAIPNIVELLKSEYGRASDQAKRDLAFDQKQKYGKSYGNGV